MGIKMGLHMMNEKSIRIEDPKLYDSSLLVMEDDYALIDIELYDIDYNTVFNYTINKNGFWVYEKLKGRVY